MNFSMKQKQTHRHREQIVVAKGEGGGMDWEFGVNRCKLLYIEWVNNKVLLSSKGKSIQHAVINYSRKECDKEYVYIYMDN